MSDHSLVWEVIAWQEESSNQSVEGGLTILFLRGNEQKIVKFSLFFLF